jgi:hypothetical protein
MSETVLSRNLRKGAIDNLVDGVDRFLLASSASKNKDTGDQLEVRILNTHLPTVIYTILAQNDARNAHGLATMAAQNAAKVLGR